MTTEPLFDTVPTWTCAMVTAHRKLPKGSDEWLRPALDQRLAKLRDIYGTETFTSGMALGGDMLTAEQALSLDFPLTAALPFPGQALDTYGPKWSQVQQRRWQGLLERASHVEYVSPVDPISYEQRTRMLHARNDWMLHRNQVVLAIWAPANRTGGTYSCIKKAVAGGRAVILFNLATQTVTMPSPPRWAELLGVPALAVARRS